MPTFLALHINPYARTATVVELAAQPPQPAAPPTLQSALDANQLYAFAAHANAVPTAHWPLMAPLVHAGRADNPDAYAGSETLDVSVRLVYKHVEHRGMLYTRDDMPVAGTPERDAIPGFAFRDSAQPGVWWNGCAVLVLYERDSLKTLDIRGFLEVTARVAISWERIDGAQHLGRMVLSVDNGMVTSSATVPTCAHCGLYIDERPKRCAACQRVYYCDAACQRAHWRLHKTFCRTVVAAVDGACA